MAMSKIYQYMQAKVRKDPFGPQTWNQLGANMSWLQEAALVEHLETGEHNAREIFRTCGHAFYDAGYTMEGANSDPTLETGHNPAVGTVIVTLAASRFSTNMVLQATPQGEACSLKPHIIGVRVASATSVEFYQKALSSALGAGNTWAATDKSFYFGINSDPLELGARLTLPAPALRPAYAERDELNYFFSTTAGLRAAAFGGHNSTGFHAIREVSRLAAYLVWDGGTGYDVGVEDGTVSIHSVTRLGTGHILIEHDSMNEDCMAFFADDFSRGVAASNAGEIIVANVDDNNETDLEVFLYAYDPDANTWDRADSNFFFLKHGQ